MASSPSPSHAYHTGKHFFLDPFGERQWDREKYYGGAITMDKAEFVEKVDAAFEASGSVLVEG